jgi:hypothetical protein
VGEASENQRRHSISVSIQPQVDGPGSDALPTNRPEAARCPSLAANQRANFLRCDRALVMSRAYWRATLSIFLEFDKRYPMRLDAHDATESILSIQHRDVESRARPLTEPFDFIGGRIGGSTALLPDVKDRVVLPIKGVFPDLAGQTYQG